MLHELHKATQLLQRRTTVASGATKAVAGARSSEHSLEGGPPEVKLRGFQRGVFVRGGDLNNWGRARTGCNI